MTVVDLHPEELLDKKARGALSASESERLDAHLARCATCRVEMQLRADFAVDLAGDFDDESDEGDRPSLTALLEGVAAARTKAPRDATPPEIEPASEERVVVAPPSRRNRRVAKAPVWFLVAAAMLAVSAATGATGVGKRVWTRVLSVVTTVDTVDSAPPEPTSAPKHASHAAPATVEPPAPTPIETPIATAIPVAEVAAPPAVVSAPAPRVAPRPRAIEAPSPEIEAAKLFDEAATARRQGDYGRAVALNRELLARFPRTREAQTSRATIGRLLLDRGDPSGALASFDAYMAAGSGELGEEAMAGRATALERLGRSDDARRAWTALLAAYPSTPYAAHARARAEAASENPGP
jgi:TolA-binding protein